MNTIVVEKRQRISKIRKAYWNFRNWFRDSIFEPIWYKFFGHKFHIIKTGLKPSPWYDSDTRILYGVMSIVTWFVENDMRVITKDEYDEELNRINLEDTENKEFSLETWKNQYEEDGKIMAIYLWWKAYSRMQKDIEKSLDEWHDYEKKFKKDPEDWFGGDKPKTEEESKESKRLLECSRQMEMQLKDEEQEYLKMAIDLRARMWS